MNIITLSIKNHGFYEEERIVFEVLQDCTLGDYVLLNTTLVGEDEPANKIQSSYLFPDRQVSKGDFVVLYTRAGEAQEGDNSAGSTTHVFYWGLDDTAWDVPGAYAVLAEISDLTLTPVGYN